MIDKILGWLKKHWWGLLVAYGFALVVAYGVIWSIAEPLDLYEGLQSLPTILSNRAFVQFGLTLLLAAYITLVLELIVRRKVWTGLQPPSQPTVYLIRTHEQLIDTSLTIINEAEQILVTTGSRARDKKYLDTIQSKLRDNPRLIHYRVLFATPHNQILKDHLQELLKIRNPASREYGYQTLYIGSFTNMLIEPENHICANEKKALIVLPSVSGIGSYDTGLVLQEAETAKSILRFVRELYNSSTHYETAEAVKNLPIARARNSSWGL
jgi:hypothetical protein